MIDFEIKNMSEVHTLRLTLHVYKVIFYNVYFHKLLCFCCGVGLPLFSKVYLYQ